MSSKPWIRIGATVRIKGLDENDPRREGLEGKKVVIVSMITSNTVAVQMPNDDGSFSAALPIRVLKPIRSLKFHEIHDRILSRAEAYLNISPPKIYIFATKSHEKYGIVWRADLRSEESKHVVAYGKTLRSALFSVLRSIPKKPRATPTDNHYSSIISEAKEIYDSSSQRINVAVFQTNVDGTRWGAQIIPTNIQQNHCGFGDTPEEALKTLRDDLVRSKKQ